jgi:hypothetical protein
MKYLAKIVAEDSLVIGASLGLAGWYLGLPLSDLATLFAALLFGSLAGRYLLRNRTPKKLS